MKYYLAPLEGITTYIYRRAYHTHYRPMEKYFTPFLVPHTKKDFNTREKNDILPAHNPGMNLVPQILTNDAKGFLDTVEKLKGYGYDEVNLNLGCPSKTVVSKGRGSGFLIHSEELNRFLDEIYAKADVKISIKTRIGKFDADEWGELLRIYNQYPLEELIVHPRVQQQFYKGHPDLDAFADAVKECKHTLCYNGDIFTTEDMEKLKKRFPEASCIMLGRGILRNPELIEIMESGEKKIDAKKLRAFHDQIYQDYQEVSCGDKNVLFKMKELWCYLGTLFPDKEKQLKKIRKAEKLQHHELIRVATKYPNIAKDYFYNKKHQTVEIVKLNGSIELAPIVGLSEVIVDIVETGSTLKENGLVVLEEVCPLSARMIVNPVSMRMENDRIKELITNLRNLLREE